MRPRLFLAAAVALVLGVTVWRLPWNVRRALPAEITLETLVDGLPEDLGGLEVLEQDVHDPVRPGAIEPADRLKQGGGQRPGLVTPPRSRVRWRVGVPAGAALRFAVGVQGDGRRDDSRSGIRFSLAVDGETRWTRALNPAGSRRDRRWFDERLELADAAGGAREVVLVTEATEPGRPLAGTAAWGQVRVVRSTSRPRQRAADGPSLLVLLVDTLRADRLGLYGNAPSPSPTLDALAARGLVFDRAVAQSSWTLPSVASLVTGLHPRSHGALGARSTRGEAKWGLLAERVETWPEAAARAGITTFGVSTNPLMSPGTNLARGFETFEELPWDPEARNWAAADEVDSRFLAFLRANRGLRFAAWLHYMEPHDPYTPPPDLKPPVPPGVRRALAEGRVHDVAREVDWGGGPLLPAVEVAWLRALYDAEIAGWDRQLARLLDALAHEGVLDRTVIVVTADHGEEFQEHGRLKHGSQLYEESIRVPLVLVGPGIPAGRVDTVAQGIDLAPTALALLGAPVPAGLPGSDLRRAAPGGPGIEADRAALAETSTGIAADGSMTDVQALRTRGWKLVELPRLARRELYDLDADPGERHDRAADDPRAAALAERLAAIAAVAPPPPARSDAPDPALAEKLRHLGYLD